MQERLEKNAAMKTAQGPYLVWFDTEYTSLDPEQARLVQVAMVITDMQGRRAGTPAQDLMTPVQLEPGCAVSDFVARECPELVRAARAENAPSVETVDRMLSERLERVTGPMAPKIGQRPILAGNTIHADRMLAQRFLPCFLNRLHYRQLDVSSLKLLWLSTKLGPEFDKEDPARVKEYLPDWDLPVQPRRHDALYDVFCSIAELNYYRKHFLRAPPGDSPPTASKAVS